VSNVIQFLQAMGADATMARMAGSEYQDAVDALEVGDSHKQALLGRDDTKLRELLDSRATMFCMIFSPEEESPKSPEPDDESETPLEDDPPMDR
jgi:hypothetical protein